MRFDHYITVPAGTEEDTPETRAVQLCYGIITGVDVLYPPGPAGLVRVQIYRYAAMLYPTNPDGSFVGDDTTHHVGGRFPLLTAPFEAKLVGWSPDATLDHTVYVSFEIESPSWLLSAPIVSVELPEEVEE